MVSYRFPCEDDSIFQLDYSSSYDWSNVSGSLEVAISSGYAGHFVRTDLTDEDVCSLAQRFNAFAVEVILTRMFGGVCGGTDK